MNSQDDLVVLGAAATAVELETTYSNGWHIMARRVRWAVEGGRGRNYIRQSALKLIRYYRDRGLVRG